MTINPLFLQHADSIAYLEKHYTADIAVSHPQLRNFISTVYANKVFYVHCYDVYTLDLETNERTILVTIPFEARCLAAAHGWICVGGETHGDCAFIHIGEENGQPGNFCHELRVETLGKEIVNSMTVQILRAETSYHRDEIVVLTSNNDHSVTMYSLSQKVPLATIECPQPMNHAVLNPDTNILAIVGDENKVYFMRRLLDEDLQDPPPEQHRYAEYEWRPLATPDLPKVDCRLNDFSFAVAFSGDGRLCAASSQGGSITIFDMDIIAEEPDVPEDAIICTFRSSRSSLWGCVRSLAFSPAPWDILAWSEDHGRIGLADMRRECVRRQHIELNKENTKEISIKDMTPPEWTSLDVKERLQRQHHQRMQYLQALRGQPPVGARSLSRRQGSVNSVQDHLSERERSIIRSLNTTISEITPYSINYGAESTQVQPSASGREYEIQLINPGPHLPRRRSSVILSPSSAGQHLTVENLRATMTASPAPIEMERVNSIPSTTRLSTPEPQPDSDMPPLMSTNDLTPSARDNSQPLPYNIPPSDPWHVIEASLLNARRPSATQASNITQIENAILAERQLADRLQRQLEDEQRLSALLRSELEARERLSELRLRELQAEQTGDEFPSPSLERLLQRQLYTERDHGQRRSQELETEIRNMSRRVSQLIDERALLIDRQLALQRQAQQHMMTSAQSSALPTTLTTDSNPDLTRYFAQMAEIDRDHARRLAMASGETSSSQSELSRRLRSMADDRAQRAQRIGDLEQQVRRAETRVALASSQNTNRARRPPSDLSNQPWASSRPSQDPSSAIPEDVRRLLEPLENLQGLPRSSNGARTTSIARPTTSGRPPRTPENQPSSSTLSMSALPGFFRTPIDNDNRIARMVLARSSADGNGNWTPLAAQRYFLGTPMRAGSGGMASGPGLEDILRDGGVGTAGLGWSPDGTKL